LADKLADGAAPVPVRETTLGLPVALSVIVNEPEREPTAVGVNVTYSEQLLLAARFAPQVLVCAKSPVITMELIVRLALPVLERVTDCAELAVFISWPLNVSELADNPGVGAAPVPLRDTTLGLPAALSVIVKVPVLGPVAVGVKVTLTVQLLLAARVVPQLLLCAKLPLMETELMLRLALPVLESVTL
jgi:hypothetical protein